MTFSFLLPRYTSPPPHAALISSRTLIARSP